MPMGRITRACVIVVSAAACGAAPVEQAGRAGEPTVWNAANEPQHDVVTLQCRGGAGYEYRSLGVRATSPSDARMAVAMTFAASAQPAGSRNENLVPGTCAPENRPLTAGEPRELHFIAAIFAQNFIGPIDVTVTSAHNRPDVRSIADYLKDPGRYWTFHASDTHRGYFDATMHEHWEDRSSSGSPRPYVAQPPPLTFARWLVRIGVSGGIATSRRNVSINGDGRLQENGTGTFGTVECSATLPTQSVEEIEAALARAHPETWRGAYPMKGDGCCDQLTYVIHLDREDDHGNRTSHEASWMSENESAVPPAVSALFKTVYDARRACVF
jgi:hypothetical protein